MADHLVPDYDLEETLVVDTPEQLRALFDATRTRIVHLLLERAATISELAATMGVPKGTMGHHVGVLADNGLIHVVRTKKVRAIEAKYYGRTARTFLIRTAGPDVAISPDVFLTAAAAEYRTASESFADQGPSPIMSTLRYARIPDERAEEWILRLGELTQEFASEGRTGETTYGMLVAFYPTDQTHLPDLEEPE
jgi:DNA-binding transcriptional ArsR family regulator